MKHYYVIATLTLLTVLSACSPSQDAIQTAIFQTQISGVPPAEIVASTPAGRATPRFVSGFDVWTVSQVITAFQLAGLEVEQPSDMEPQDYGLAPLVASEGKHFYIYSLCEDCGGRVFSFTSPDDLEHMRHYFDELGRSSAAFYSWVFVRDNILVQINGDLPEEQANQYETTLLNLSSILTEPPPTRTIGPTATITPVATLTMYSINDSVSSGSFLVTLNAAEIVGEKLIANFTIMNQGSKAEIMSSFLGFSARSADGTKLETEFCDSNSLDGTIVVGDSLRGDVCFVAPAEILGTRIYFTPDFLPEHAIVFQLNRQNN